MNTIKNSFSKIKASDEFKDKLLRELQASQTKLNNSNEKTLSKSNVLNSLASPKEHLVTTKIYSKQYIAAAATFVILAGIVSFKLIIPDLEKGRTDSEVIAYAPQTEPATENDDLTESYEKSNNNNTDISSQSSKTYISSNNSEASVTSKNTETNLTSKKIESATSSAKNETSINTKVESNIQPKANENDSNSKIIKDSASSISEIPVSKNDAAQKTEAPLTRNSMSIEKDSSANSDKISPINDTTNLTNNAPPENRNVIENTSINSDNVITAKFQTYADWNNGTGTFYSIDNNDLLKNLLNEINLGTPYLPEDVEASLEDYKNENGCKKISFDLKDGVKNVTFTIFKNGYVYYDSAKIYLKIDSNFAEELWNSLNMMKTN